MVPPLKAVAELVVVGIAGVEFQRDDSCGDIDDEFAIAAVVVFPAAMFLLQVVVAKGLDRFSEGEFRSSRLRLSPLKLLDRDGRRG